MTWMDVRDALAAGKTTAIIADRRHRAERPVARAPASTTTCCRPTATRSRASSATRCARRSSSTCPKATSSRRRATWRSPGTISLREETFRAVLTDIAHSLKPHGFKTHHLHRRQRRQPGRPARRGGVAEQAVERRSDGRAHPGVLRLRRASASYMEGQGIKEGASDEPARRSDHHAQHVHRPTRSRSATMSA